jgi:hypothetical protein
VNRARVNIVMASFPCKTLPNGRTNQTYVDVLDEDRPLAQQKFCCISFISPETVLKDKSLFMFGEFLRTYEPTKAMERFADFMAFVSHKYDIDATVLTEDLQDFCDEEKSTLQESDLESEYKTFLDRNGDRLEDMFSKKHSFRTTVRGLKVRGVFPTQGEAELRAKMLREADQSFDVFVGPVGIWMPWEPDAYKTGRVDHLEPELNQLAQGKLDNEAKAKEYFEQRVKDAKRKAIEENIRKAEETGAKLTQTITDDGQLVGVRNMNTHESNLLGLGGEVTREQVEDELFNGAQSVPEGTDHGLSALMLNQRSAGAADGGELGEMLGVQATAAGDPEAATASDL